MERLKILDHVAFSLPLADDWAHEASKSTTIGERDSKSVECYKTIIQYVSLLTFHSFWG
jgi:hypothetical protein